MRRFLFGALGLVLGCVVAQAQDIRWHAAASPPVQARPEGDLTGTGSVPAAQAPAAVLGRPAGERATKPLQADPLLRPVAFNQEDPAAARLVFRGKGQEGPLPAGPILEGAEPIPHPQLLSPVPKTDPGSASTDCWGGTLSPWGTAGPAAGPVVGVPGGAAGVVMGSDGACLDSDCPPCPDCCDCRCTLPGRVWGSAEYLLWFPRHPNLPPLVTTTGSLTAAQLLALRMANPSFNPGAIGQLGTSVVVGGNNLSQGAFDGGRFTLGVGVWHELGLETTFFFIGPNSQNTTMASSGVPGLFRPFTDAVSGNANAEFVAFPNVVSGNVNVSYRTNFWGAEANFRYPLLCGCRYRLDLLAGFRFLDLDENLQVNEALTFQVTSPAAGVNAGDSIRVTDHFGTINHFYGGQVGADFEWRFGSKCKWFLGAMGKVALGSTHEVININGNTVFTPLGGMSTTMNGGLLTQPTNIGHFSQDRFAVAPEVALKIGYMVTEHLKLYAGYDFLYMSNVLRPADQVDLTVNTSQLPRLGGSGTLVGPARPAVPFHQTNFFVHGAKFGLEYDW
jgi:hypothetical protein